MLFIKDLIKLIANLTDLIRLLFVKPEIQKELDAQKKAEENKKHFEETGRPK